MQLTTIFAVAAAAATIGTTGTPATSGVSKGATIPLPKLPKPIVGVVRVAGDRWRIGACGARASPRVAPAKNVRALTAPFDLIVGWRCFYGLRCDDYKSSTMQVKLSDSFTLTC